MLVCLAEADSFDQAAFGEQVQGTVDGSAGDLESDFLEPVLNITDFEMSLNREDDIQDHLPFPGVPEAPGPEVISELTAFFLKFHNHAQ